jgi:hypothetical protein
MKTITKPEIIGRLDAIIDVLEILSKHSAKGSTLELDIESLKRLRKDIKLKRVV